MNAEQNDVFNAGLWVASFNQETGRSWRVLHIRQGPARGAKGRVRSFRDHASAQAHADVLNAELAEKGAPMPHQRDDNDALARKSGFEVACGPKVSSLAQNRYILGAWHVWQIGGLRTGHWWQVARIGVRGHYVEHSPQKTLKEALLHAKHKHSGPSAK